MNDNKDTWTNNDGLTYTFTWIKDREVEKYLPQTQVYGVCFNEDGEILVQRDPNMDNAWALPGGTPERSETAEETLRRELIEEVDVEVSTCIPLGAQMVEIPNNPKKSEGDKFYQLRYVCLVSKLLPQTPDPDNGRIHERKFVQADKINEIVKWGKSGAALFKDAIALYETL